MRYLKYVGLVIALALSLNASAPDYALEYHSPKRGGLLIRVVNLTSYQIFCDIHDGDYTVRFTVKGRYSSWHRVYTNDYEVSCR